MLNLRQGLQRGLLQQRQHHHQQLCVLPPSPVCLHHHVQRRPGMFRRGGKAAAAAPAAPQQVNYDKIALGADMPADYDKDIPKWSERRRAGVIIHPTSLPGPYGIGEIGEQARKLVDWMETACLQCWQILPLVPPDPMFYSPYSGTDSNAGNPLVISIDDLIRDGLLDSDDAPARVPVADIDFPQVKSTRMGVGRGPAPTAHVRAHRDHHVQCLLACTHAAHTTNTLLHLHTSCARAHTHTHTTNHPTNQPQVAATKAPLLKKAVGRLLSDAKFADLRKELTAWRRCVVSHER